MAEKIINTKKIFLSLFLDFDAKLVTHPSKMIATRLNNAKKYLGIELTSLKNNLIT